MLSAAKHLAAHRERSFAEFTLSEANGLSMTSDPRLLPILVGKNHYRPMARRCAPQADKSAVRQ